MSAVSYEVWIKNLEPLCVSEGGLVLVAASPSTKVFIQKNHQELLNSTVHEVNGALSRAVIITSDDKNKYIENKAAADTLDDSFSLTKKDIEDTTAPSFTSKYTFQSFVVGASNNFAYAAAMATAQEPGTKYNPLFLYGGVGLGKTHLMHAIGNHIRQHNPKLKILYVPTAQFSNELVDAMMNSKDRDLNKEFREKYRNVDVLMLDDVQYLAGKSGTQDAIFHVFNDLFQNGKQIILSSDRPPKEISPLEDRIRTRFEWGLLADIQAPDLETRMAILRKKAVYQGAQVSDQVLRFIAEKVESNIREMEGLLSKVVFYANLVGKPATTLDIAYEALKDYVDNTNTVLDANYIIDMTCSFFKVSRSDMCGKKKTKNIVEPRQICMYLVHEILGLPLAAIGGYFSGRDHTTVIYAKEKVTNLINTNASLKRQITDLYNMIIK